MIRNLRSRLQSRLIRAVVGLIVVGVAFLWAVPTIASYRDVWTELGKLETLAALTVAAVGITNVLTPATAHRASLPGMRYRDALVSDWTTSAITNTVPGGSALAIAMTWTMYRSFGHDDASIGRSVVVTGVWDTFVKFSTPLLALIWLSTERPIGPGLIQAALVGAVLFVIVVILGVTVLSGPSIAERLGSLLNRVPFLGDTWPERLSALRADTVELLRTRWRSLTFWTLIGHANLYLLLLVCLRGVGVDSGEASAAAVLAALAFGRLITAIPLSPGGLGVMELGLIGALATVSQADEAALVAAVLMFRALTLIAPIFLGAFAWLYWTTTTLGTP